MGDVGGVPKLTLCTEPGGDELGVTLCATPTGDVLRARGETGFWRRRLSVFIRRDIRSLNESVR